MINSRCIHVAAVGIISFFIFMANIIFYISTTSYQFFCQWTFGLLQVQKLLDYCKQCFQMNIIGLNGSKSTISRELKCSYFVTQ